MNNGYKSQVAPKTPTSPIYYAHQLGSPARASLPLPSRSLHYRLDEASDKNGDEDEDEDDEEAEQQAFEFFKSKIDTNMEKEITQTKTKTQQQPKNNSHLQHIPEFVPRPLTPSSSPLTINTSYIPKIQTSNSDHPIIPSSHHQQPLLSPPLPQTQTENASTNILFPMELNRGTSLSLSSSQSRSSSFSIPSIDSTPLHQPAFIAAAKASNSTKTTTATTAAAAKSKTTPTSTSNLSNQSSIFLPQADSFCQRIQMNLSSSLKEMEVSLERKNLSNKRNASKSRERLQSGEGLRERFLSHSHSRDRVDSQSPLSRSLDQSRDRTPSAQSQSSSLSMSMSLSVSQTDEREKLQEREVKDLFIWAKDLIQRGGIEYLSEAREYGLRVEKHVGDKHANETRRILMVNDGERARFCKKIKNNYESIAQRAITNMDEEVEERLRSKDEQILSERVNSATQINEMNALISYLQDRLRQKNTNNTNNTSPNKLPFETIQKSVHVKITANLQRELDIARKLVVEEKYRSGVVEEKMVSVFKEKCEAFENKMKKIEEVYRRKMSDKDHAFHNGRINGQVRFNDTDNDVNTSLSEYIQTLQSSIPTLNTFEHSNDDGSSEVYEDLINNSGYGVSGSANAMDAEIEEASNYTHMLRYELSNLSVTPDANQGGYFYEDKLARVADEDHLNEYIDNGEEFNLNSADDKLGGQDEYSDDDSPSQNLNDLATPATPYDINVHASNHSSPQTIDYTRTTPFDINEHSSNNPIPFQNIDDFATTTTSPYDVNEHPSHVSHPSSSPSLSSSEHDSLTPVPVSVLNEQPLELEQEQEQEHEQEPDQSSSRKSTASSDIFESKRDATLADYFSPVSKRVSKRVSKYDKGNAGDDVIRRAKNQESVDGGVVREKAGERNGEEKETREYVEMQFDDVVDDGDDLVGGYEA